ncbi:hypothetical protein LCGC14_2017320 [marine sediment metagenome]|uniref:Uncharacterized protein n=1 Tax=marine sediment metagenome TaxID=412755 RepID=A0A0F9HVN3_9ZZZZ
MNLSEEINKKTEENFSITLRGELEIQFNENITKIADIDVSAKNSEMLLGKILNQITLLGLSTAKEAIQLLVKKQGGS